MTLELTLDYMLTSFIFGVVAAVMMINNRMK